MADKYIRQEFIDSTMEIFTTLFNDGSETTDGVYLYLLSEDTQTNVYGEQKYKTYKPPVLLVCHVRLVPTQGNEDVKGIKNQTTFKVPLQSLLDYNLGVTDNDLRIMRKGMMRYKDTYYVIDNITPSTYVEDTFLFYSFECTEAIDTTSLNIEPEDTDE